MSVILFVEPGLQHAVIAPAGISPRGEIPRTVLTVQIYSQSSETPNENMFHLHPNRNFSEFLGKWKAL